MGREDTRSAADRTIATVLLLIDNYDSFTFNLVQRFGEIDRAVEVRVVRNDGITVEAAEELSPTHLVISPGPCTPKEAGVSAALIARFRGRIPILGVCLGHQTIGDCHGMVVRRNDEPVHGKTSEIHHDGRGLFEGLSNPFVATRYHSLVVEPSSVHADFEVTAWTERGEIMGLRWKAPEGASPLEGVQFHPESFLTTEGPRLLANFLRMR
jgi:anthranilate synthase/aminodeoxychorismate synthase-like glutamine amidotransferase